MDKLKQNAFWIGLGAAGVVILAILGLFWWPAYSAADAAFGQITRDIGTVTGSDEKVSNKDIQKHKERYRLYKDNLDSIQKYYANMDAELEKWLGGQTPNWTTFEGRLRDAKTSLVKMLKSEKIAIGREEGAAGTSYGSLREDNSDDQETLYGFKWEFPTPDSVKRGTPKQEMATAKVLQKRYWIRRRIAEVAMEADASRIWDVHFFNKPENIIQLPSVSQNRQDLASYVGFEGTMNRNQPSEFSLPEGMGKTITFGFTLDVKNSNVPKLIRAMLRSDQEPKMLVMITGIRSYIRRQNKTSIEVRVPPDKQDQKDALVQAAMDELKPIPMTVQLTCRIIDYEEPKKGETAAQ